MNTFASGISAGLSKTAQNSGQRKSILNRRTPFDPVERAAFNARILEFWQEAESLARPFIKLHAELLRAEARAVLAVGRKPDLEKLSGCRRTTLEKLGESEEQRHYIDLLLNIAQTHFQRGEHQAAQAIHEVILGIEPGNWHSLKEMALVRGVQGNLPQALDYFNRAKTALAAYPYEVSGEMVWEASAFEARYRLYAAVAEKPGMGRDEVAEILSPVLRVPDVAFRATLLLKIRADLVDRGASIPVIVSVLREIIAAEEKEEVAELPALGEMPVSLLETAGRLAERGDKIAEVAAGFEEVGSGMGRVAVAVYALIGIGRLFREKGTAAEKEAKALLKEAGKAVSLGKETARELQAFLKTDAASEQEKKGNRAAAREIEEVLRRMRLEQGRISEDTRRMVRDFIRVFAKIKKEDVMTRARQGITEVLGEVLAQPPQIREAAVRANDLWGLEAELDQAIVVCFERALEDETTRKLIFDGLRKTRTAVDKGVEVEGEGKVFYDFFAVHLRELQVVRQIFAEISGNPFIEPVRLNSYWYEKMGKFAKALEADPANLMARIELSRLRQVEGNLDGAESLMEDPQVDTDNLLVKIRTAALKIERLVVRAERAVEREGEEKTPLELIDLGVVPNDEAAEIAEEAKEIFFRAGETSLRVGAVIKGIKPAYEDWVEAAGNVAFLYFLAYDYDRAIEYYDQILLADRWNKRALYGKATLLALQGKYVEASKLMLTAAQNNPRTAVFHLFHIEILCLAGQYGVVVKALRAHLSSAPDNIRFLLAKAQFTASAGNVDQAQELFSRAKDLHGKNPHADDGYDFWGTREAFIKLTQAVIDAHSGRTAAALAGYQRALTYFPPRNIYWHLQVRWSRARQITLRAAEVKDNDRLVAQGLQEAALLLRRAPFDPYSHQLIVPPLIAEGEERRALTSINYLIGNLEDKGHFSRETLLNLVYLTFKESDCKEEASESLLSLAARYETGGRSSLLGKSLQGILEQVRQDVPSCWQHFPERVMTLFRQLNALPEEQGEAA